MRSMCRQEFSISRFDRRRKVFCSLFKRDLRIKTCVWIEELHIRETGKFLQSSVHTLNFISKAEARKVFKSWGTTCLSEEPSQEEHWD